MRDCAAEEKAVRHPAPSAAHLAVLLPVFAAVAPAVALVYWAYAHAVLDEVDNCAHVP